MHCNNLIIHEPACFLGFLKFFGETFIFNSAVCFVNRVACFPEIMFHRRYHTACSMLEGEHSDCIYFESLREFKNYYPHLSSVLLLLCL